ncbi:hypothetical protein B0H14DRAFT_2556725 [Mycena olivaceomarginata]|nr:hypothetical protein B0H14DRAFT_2556725 [Mycena olivaceomarginata]
MASERQWGRSRRVRVSVPPRILLTTPLALSTKDILGTTPSLYHPALINRDTKQKLINQVKDEGSDTLQETQTVATYIAKQQARPPEERYIQSIYQRDGKTIIFGLRKGGILGARTG